MRKRKDNEENKQKKQKKVQLSASAMMFL